MHNVSALERAILQTVHYYSVLTMPVTASQIWQGLVVEGMTEEIYSVSIESVHGYSLEDVQVALDESEFLNKYLDTKWGYYFIQGQEDIVRERLTRHSLAQQKWKIGISAAHILACMPFVQALAGSGSLALDNTKSTSDLDFFIIVHPRRIWTVRLMLLLVSQLLGRRRRHWDTVAPDKLCLNHYVSSARLLVESEVQSLYTAIMYTHMVPLFNRSLVETFRLANKEWIQTYVMAPATVSVSHNYEFHLSLVTSFMKRLCENFLLEPIGDGVEYLAESIQRYIIRWHGRQLRSGRIALSQYELAFHPNSRVPDILATYHQLRGSARENLK